jgi:flagellar assembly protein FliH
LTLEVDEFQYPSCFAGDEPSEDDSGVRDAANGNGERDTSKENPAFRRYEYTVLPEVDGSFANAQFPVFETHEQRIASEHADAGDAVASSAPRDKFEGLRWPDSLKDSSSVEERERILGFDQGMKRGRELGLEAGLEQGMRLGREQGLEEGLAQGQIAGREAGREEGWEQGRVRGFEEGTRHLEIERERLCAQAAALTTSFVEARDHCLDHLEREAVHLALAIAARVLRHEVQMDPLLLTGSVRVALGQLAASTSVRLRVPAADQPLWEEAIRHIPGLASRPQVVGDPQMELGECRMETEVGNADLGLSAQLKTIEKGFFEHSDASECSTDTIAEFDPAAENASRQGVET